MEMIGALLITLSKETSKNTLKRSFSNSNLDNKKLQKFDFVSNLHKLFDEIMIVY